MIKFVHKILKNLQSKFRINVCGKFKFIKCIYRPKITLVEQGATQ